MKKNHAIEWDCSSCRLAATRREFLMSLGALGAAALFPGLSLGQSGTAPFRIDIHHHFLSPGYLAEIVKRNLGNPVYRNWTPQFTLDEMGKGGVATAMLSLSRPGVWFGDVPLARSLSRELNDYCARLVRDYPGRFGMFATLPLPDVEGSLREIEYAYDVLKVDGIAVMSNYDDIYLGDPKLAPVMDELNRRKAIVYEHPVREDRENPLNAIELVTETTRTIASLIWNATVVRCPDIRFIFAHGGGTIANVYATRMVNMVAKLPKGLEYELQKFYYDTAQAHDKALLLSYKTLAPVSHILFGTDWPFIPSNGTAVTAKGLRDNGGFTAAELRAIERDNALALFPRLKT
jgi:6-methylsalicylate decarboxylase